MICIEERRPDLINDGDIELVANYYLMVDNKFVNKSKPFWDSVGVNSDYKWKQWLRERFNLFIDKGSCPKCGNKIIKQTDSKSEMISKEYSCDDCWNKEEERRREELRIWQEEQEKERVRKRNIAIAYLDKLEDFEIAVLKEIYSRKNINSVKKSKLLFPTGDDVSRKKSWSMIFEFEDKNLLALERYCNFVCKLYHVEFVGEILKEAYSEINPEEFLPFSEYKKKDKAEKEEHGQNLDAKYSSEFRAMERKVQELESIVSSLNKEIENLEKKLSLVDVLKSELRNSIKLKEQLLELI